MDALEALHSRVSSGRLGGEPPSGEVLDAIRLAALRAPDHALLRPWRFLTITGTGRERLGDLFVAATLHDDPEASQAAQNKASIKPLRAPMIIVAIARTTQNDKVPVIEQILSTGAAAQNMLIAAHALGVGAMWWTGSMAYHNLVKSGLGLSVGEEIVGFLYLGNTAGRIRPVPELDPDDFFSNWG